MRDTRGPARMTQGGFVLVEALLALILLSVTLAMFAAALQLGQRVAAAGRARDQITAVAAGIDAISGLIGKTMPVADRVNDQPPIVVFEGRPNGVAFVTLSQGETHAGGLLATAIRFVARRGANGVGAIDIGTALLRMGDRPSLAGVGGAAGREVLVANVSAAEFSYFGAKAEGQPALWHSAWTGASMLPQLVSLRARVRLRGQEQTLEFTFRLLNG